MKHLLPYTMKKSALALVIGLLLIPFLSKAQNDVSVSIQILPPYPTKVDQYADPGKTIITLRSNSPNIQNLQLLGSILGENGIEIRTNPSFKSPQPIVLNAGETKVLNAFAVRELFDINTLNVRGITRDELIRGNGLPEGTYRVCVRAFDYQTNLPLSQDDPLGCSGIIRLTNLEPPMLIKPYFDEIVKATTPQNIIFTWSFPAGAPPSTQFKLKIVEIFNQERNINDAMLSSTTPPFFEQSVTGNAFVYGPAQPTLIKGRKYAFMVTAIDPFGKVVFRNGGRSEVSTFTFGEAGGLPDFGTFKVMEGKMPITCACALEIPSGTVDNSKAIVGSKVKVGKFEMTVLEVKEESGILKGRGKINFPMINSKLIPLLVEFGDLQVNSTNQAITGTVRARIKTGIDFIPTVAAPNIQSIPFTLSDVQKLDEYFKANTNQIVSNINSSIDNAGFEMPLGLDRNIGGVNTIIAITGATFSPTQATFEAATVVNIPDGATKIAFGAKGVCMDNAGLCGQGTLFLAEDLNINAINMKLKGAATMLLDPVDSGTYVVFDKDGFQRLRIQAEYAFPTSLIVQKKDKTSQVKATLTTSAVSWSNWIANVSIDPFTIVGNNEFAFTLVGGGIYDHSSSTNPTGMPVIEGKSNISTTDWNGFYLGELKVDLPAAIKNISSPDPLAIGVKNLIIDNQGVSGSIKASNILSIGNGDLGGWYYSVDDIGVNFLNNSFVSGGMNGKVFLPICGGNPENPKGQVDYTCTLSQPSGSIEFQFVMKPKDDLDVPLWYSKFALAKTSNILVKAGGGKFYGSATLNGHMDIVADLSPVSKVNFKAMEFEELKLQTEAPYIAVKSFNAGFNSPTKSVSGFPVGLEEIKPIISGSTAGIGFTMFVTLSDIPSLPQAKFSLQILGKLNFEKGRPSWKFDKVSPEKISIKGPVGPLSVDGTVEFFDKDMEFGDGVRGSLTATFISGFSTTAQVMFGNTTFSYWYIDARVKFPAGIPMAGPIPLSVFGFGGGAYYHLAQKALPDAKALFETTPSVTSLYTPDINNMGFKATIIMGVSDGSSYQMEGTLETSLNPKTMTPTMMKLEVRAAMLAPLMDTEKAYVKGEGKVEYDFANDVFTAKVNVLVNLAKVIDGRGSIHLNINGRAKTWFFKIGEPSNRITLSLLKFASVGAYYMMGNEGIPGIPEPPAEVLKWIGGYKGGRTSLADGKGLAFGASMAFGPVDLRFLIFYLRLEAGLGFDLSLRQQTEDCDKVGGLPGVNGWYANGQMYMYASFDFGLRVDVWFYEGNVSAGSAGMGALLVGGLPNPVWFEGWVNGKYNVLNGLISGSMNFHVKVGEKCVPSSSPFGGIPLISDLKPAQDDTPILADPQVAFNFPVNTDFVIPTMDEDGREVNRKFFLEINQFDVVNNKTGQIVCSTSKNRALKMSMADRLATIYKEEAFDPRTKYTIRAKVKAFEIIGASRIACVNKGKPVEEYREAVFTTGECVTKLDKESVLATYPISNQRYLLQKESTTGFVELSEGIPCFLNDNKNDIVAIFTAYKSRFDASTFEAPATYSGYRISFNIPNLPNEQIVEVKIVKRRKAGNTGNNNLVASNLSDKMQTNIGKQNFSFDGENRYIGAYNFVNVSKASILAVSTSLKAIPDVEIYKFYFRTSKFNTLTEKLTRSEKTATAKRTKFGLMEIYEGEYGLEEGFDTYDVNGHKYYGLGGMYKQGPLILVSESSPRNKWSESYIRNDFYVNWMRGFYGGYIEELTPKYIRPFNVPVDEAFLFAPPSRPIDFNLTTIDPPLSKSEINAVVGPYIIKNTEESQKFIVPKFFTGK